MLGGRFDVGGAGERRARETQRGRERERENFSSFFEKKNCFCVKNISDFSQRKYFYVKIDRLFCCTFPKWSFLDVCFCISNT